MIKKTIESKYPVRGVRVYNPAMYDKFLAICKGEHLSATYVVNKFVENVVAKGKTEAI